MTASIILILSIEVFGIGIQRDFDKLFQPSLDIVPRVKDNLDTALSFEQKLDVSHATAMNNQQVQRTR